MLLIATNDQAFEVDFWNHSREGRESTRAWDVDNVFDVLRWLKKIVPDTQGWKDHPHHSHIKTIIDRLLR
jgi:hypothetical protein